MSSNNSGKGYTVTSSGTNSQVCYRPWTPFQINWFMTSQGNHYCSRDYSSGGSQPANSNSYHYSNSNGNAMSSKSSVSRPSLIRLVSLGSYYYSNPNGSTYYNNGNGGSKYTSSNSKWSCFAGQLHSLHQTTLAIVESRITNCADWAGS